MSKLTQSYVNGASTVPLIYKTIGRAFDDAVVRWGNREALVVCHQGIRWTYDDLKREVDACAAALLALGLEPGDRIGIWAPNCAEWTVVQYATAKAGLVLVNINPAYRVSELEYALNKVECQALVLAPRFKSSDYVQMISDLAPELKNSAPGDLRAEKLPHLRTVVHLGNDDQSGMFRFADLKALANDSHHKSVVALSKKLMPDDPINVQFTSGTTGFSKAATLTHFNILNNGYFVGANMHFTEKDRLCIPVPLYHCFGMVMGNLVCLSHGATAIYPDEAFEPLSVLKAVEAEHCTALHGVPTMFLAEVDHPEFSNFDLSSLRTGIMAGASCPIELMKRVVEEMNLAEMTIAYGMTETSPVSFQSTPDDTIERRVSTVGAIMPHVEVKIIDEDGQVVPSGERGELCTRGYSVMRGYWNDDEKTESSIDAGGWMHTGDLATLDEDGYGNIVGRLKDMVIRGGENVYPREVEEYLYRHENIQEVQVFGVPGPKYGEELCAWIKTKDGHELSQDAIRTFCQGQIAHYKIPRYVKCVGEFPMTVTGKIQKFIMREQMIEELRLVEQKTA
ncbi:MAG TPA: AMP-binding protein [Sneathiellales bacterium]|nr:AMP-binding protein [Sneathiellales bacterium]